MHDLTWLEISRKALIHNVRTFKRSIGPVSLFLVVKSNAYGHGVSQVVKTLNAESSVTGFMVASLDEALALRTKKPIIVLSMWQREPQAIVRAVKRGIALPVYDSASAAYLSRIAARNSMRIPIQIKIDVGTSRIGFRWDTFADYVRVVKNEHFVIKGVFGHFADSENADQRFTLAQEQRFRQAVQRITEACVGPAPMAHIACSAASVRSRAYLHDAVRVGIGLYGLWPSVETRQQGRSVGELLPVLTWKTRVLQVKELRTGDTVGYGMTYRAPKKMRLAIVAVGYWDGYDRRCSNNAFVLIQGMRCPVRGRICMNMMMVEVPRSTVIKPYDEVVLLGSQKKTHMSAEELAERTGTIHYEVVTRINPLLPRRVV